MNPELIFIPIRLAELLHATLGPLSEVLEREDHPWTPMVRKVLSEYCHERNGFLVEIHGPSVLSEIGHQTFLASERVCDLTDYALREEEDFSRWREEVEGEIA
jgi:hypothetical protein